MEKSSIFIVEDEALIAMELKDRLTQMGHTVCGTAAKGEEALTEIIRLSPDLVMMDIRLSGEWDGIETAEKLHERVDVPVIYVTAFSDVSLIDRATKSGSFGYLMKPFNESEIQATINMALYKSRMERRIKDVNSMLSATVELLDRQRSDILKLHRMGESLQRCENADEAYSEVKRSIQGLFPHLPGFLAILDKGNSEMEVKESWGGLTVNNRFQMLECPTVNTGEMDAEGTCHPGISCIQVMTPAPHAYLCIPLKTRDRITGLLHLSQPPEEKKIPPATLELARAAAETISLALSNLSMREELNEQAIHDPLTGLHNRRFLKDTLDHQLAQAVREGAPVGVMMLDLDHFKQFNDTYGHEAGDRLLSEFGAYMRTHTRHGDYVYRFGGEEFVIVLPRSMTDDTRKRAEDLLRGLPGMAFEHLGKTLGGVTVSIGIAQCPEDGISAEVLLRNADRALYRAKELGRNRVETAEEDRSGIDPQLSGGSGI